MKWTITMLIALGALAALFAAILIGTLPSRFAVGPDSTAVAVVMKTSLPARSQITEGDIVKNVSPRDKLPIGYVSYNQAVGRILAVPVVTGQTLTEFCLVSEGSGPQLAAALTPGMRAVSVTLPKLAVKGGMLYPGCIVDVLASFRIQSMDRGQGQAVSATLLNNIQVLAVGDTSVVSRKESSEHASDSQITVTLMVDPKQAEAIQLATGYGSIYLAMRNPLDKKRADMDATVLNESRLAKFGSVMSLPVSFAEGAVASADPNNTGNELSTGPADIAGPLPGKGGANPQWGVTIIRGREVQEEKLGVPEDHTISEKSSKE